MIKIRMQDVKNRLIDLSNSYVKPATVNTESLFKSIGKKYNYNTACIILKEWETLNPNTNIAFTQVMDVFSLVCENDTISHIKSFASVISEEVIPKTRDAVQTQYFIKRKISNIKTKISTKINNNVDAMKNAVANSLGGATTNIKSNTDQVKDNIATGLGKEEKEKTVEECLNMFFEQSVKYINCDRVLKNHDKLNKRFNMNKIVTEIRSEDDIVPCILELCSFIDTYDTIDTPTKYNIALENIRYLFDKNCIEYESSQLAGTVTDYFLMNTESLNESTIKDLNKITSNTKFFTEEELKDVSKLISFAIVTDPTNLNENGRLDSIVEEANANQVKVLIDAFKTQASKTPETLKALVNKIYTKSAENIVDETPNFLSWVRTFFVFSSMAINPILGAVALFTDQCIKLTLEKKQTEKIISSYKKEKEKAEKRLDKIKTDSGRERCKSYIKELDKDIDKLEMYYDNLLTEKEREEKEASKYDDDEGDFDYNFNENLWLLEGVDLSNAANILLIEKVIDSLKQWNPVNIMEALSHNLDTIGMDEIDALTEFSLIQPDMLNPIRLASVYESHVKDIKVNVNSIEKYQKIDCLSENMYKLNQYKPKAVVFEEDMSIQEINAITEAAVTVNNIVLEMDFTNSLKLSIENLKKSAVKLSDKEKIVSRNIDVSMNTLKTSTERALTNDNREAVIRGSILPSASKILKTSITTGAAWLVNPALAVIGLIGSIAISKKLQSKERQLILDDIEINLKMLDKYIRLAEDNNDMDALRNLLQQQRALERQKQRIKYKMKIYYNQNTPDVKSDNDN